MSDVESIHSLLQNIIGVMVKYEPIHREHRFNIFSILRNSHEEVALHSRFIAEILNPKGKHGHGDEFLNLFLQRIDAGEPGPTEGQRGRSTVEIERWFHIDDADGRIDILIRTPSRIVVIENKIYASDQYQQLDRYYRFAKQEARENSQLKPVVCYLTLQGGNPDESTWSEDTEHPALRVLSYGDIRDWLDDCLGPVALEPTLRETIRQYQYLIDKLTGNTMAARQKEEIITAITRNQESVQAAKAIHQAWYDARANGILSYWDKLEKQLGKITHGFPGVAIVEVQKFNKKKVFNLVSQVNKKANANHGIMVALQRSEDDSLMCLYVEASANHGMIYGITMVEFDAGGKPNRRINDQPRFEDLRKAIIPESFNRSPWWLGWSALQDIPNIAQPQNDDVLDLMIEGSSDIAVTETIKQVDRLLTVVREGLSDLADRLR